MTDNKQRGKRQIESGRQRKAQQLENLLEVARLVTASYDIKKVLRQISSQAKEILAAHSCSIYLLKEDGQALTPLIAIDPTYKKQLLSTPLGVETSCIDQAINLRKSLMFNNARANPSGRQISDICGEQNGCLIVAPFIVDNKAIGAMCWNRTARPFSVEDLGLAEVIASLTVMALKNAAAHPQLPRETDGRKRTEKAVRKTHEQLESRVRERTAELVRANEALISEMANRRQTEEALQESQQKLRAIFDGAVDAIFTKDIQGRYVTVNRAFCEYFGLPSDQLIGITDFDLFPPKNAQHIRETDERVFRGEIVIEEDTKPLNGKTYSFHVTKVPLYDDMGKIYGLCGIARDVTKQKEAEEQLKTSHRRFEDIAENSFGWIWEVDADGKYIYSSPAVEKILGYHPEEILQRHFYDLFSAEEREELKKQAFQAFMKKQPFREFINRNQHKNGTTVWLATSGVPILDEQGNLLGYRGSDIDITERIRAEKALQAEKDKFRQYLDIAKTMFVAINADQTVSLVNKKSCEILGYQEHEIHGKNWFTNFIPEENRDEIRALFDKLLGEEMAPVEYFENFILTKSGEKRLIAWHNTIVKNDAGMPIGTLSSGVDITERKSAEEALRASEERFRELANSLPQVIFETDEKGDLTFANRNAHELFGYSEDDLRNGINVLQTVSPEDRDRARENMLRIMCGEDLGGNEYIALKKNGTQFPVAIHSKAIIRDGAASGLRGIIVDISDRARAEERFRLTAQVTTDLIYEWDVRTDSLQWFGNLDKALGYEPGEIPRTLEGWANLIHPEDLKQMKSSVELHRTSTEPIHDEYRVRRKDGRWLYWMDRATPVLDENSRPVKWIGGCTDITERKRSEAIQKVLYQISNAVHTAQDLNELLNEIRKQLSTVLNTENFFIALYNREDDTLSLPYFKDEKDHFETFPAGKTLTAYVINHDKPLLATREEFEKLSQSGEVETIGTDSKIWLGVPLKVDMDIIGALVVQSYTDEKAYDEKDLELLKFVSHQIGLSIERKRAQEALKTSEKRYRIVTDQTGQLIYDCDLKNGNIEWSGAIEAVTGHTPREFQKVDHNRRKEMIHPDDREKTQRCFQEAQTTSSAYRVEYRFRTKKDDYRNICDEGVFLSDDNGAAPKLLGAMKDVTEQKRAEQALRERDEQLRQSQKMEAVGRLAGGVAHDLNNLLTGVTGYGDLLASKIPENDSLRRYVIEIQKAAQRASALIGQLLTFSRKQTLQLEVLSVNGTIQNMQDMLRRVMGEDIQLSISLAQDLGPVKADPAQLEQVIMNLAVNARDAMPQGGRLTITTANAELDEQNARRHGDAQPGHYVMLTMSDTGVGMDDDTRRRIFEPFFTTKEVGKGTGLGLSTIYGIVKQSGGNIWVYSEPGRGTTFKIFLPRIEKDRTAMVPRAPGSGRQRGTETILLVEDEKMIRELAQETLQKNGYTVLVAHNGLEALSVCKHEEGPIHLLITDVIMPQMNGSELAQRLATQRKKMKVLFMSGYPDEFITHIGELNSKTNFLQKPFTSEALAVRVRQVLDARELCEQKTELHRFI